MTDSFNQLAQQLCNKPSLDACTAEELYQLTQQFPYFAPVQILYLKKLKGSPEYDRQYQKAILYHNDPLTFETLVHPEKFKNDWNWEEPLVDEEVHMEAINDTQEFFPEINNKKVEIPNEALIEEFEDQREIEVEDNMELPPLKPVEIIQQELTHEKQETSLELTEVQKESEEITILEIPEQTTPVSQSIQQGELQTVTKPKDELLFEPYHTVDYFASQGIKLSQEEATSDKFGKQLKSFTEWLKVMKRLPASERNQQLNNGREQKVENLAQHSVKDSDIITEAMAEVWVKQGNRDKAKEVYHKLGLLNPSKRAYFAAKIEELTI